MLRSLSALAPIFLAGALAVTGAPHAGVVGQGMPPDAAGLRGGADAGDQAYEGTSRRGALPRSSLDVSVEGKWVRWWRSEAAPVRWSAPHGVVAAAVEWEPMGSGVELGELRLRGRGEAWRLRVILVRFDPAVVAFRQVLVTRDYGALGAWTIDSVPAGVLVAFNGGHFSGGEPWGWKVRDGRELQPPGTGTLAAALVRDTAGAVRVLAPEAIAAARVQGGIAEALQSYPMLLRDDGIVPTELRAVNQLIDLSHRDARLAACELRDGRTVVAMTRFDALDGRFSQLPFGPTIPEMAALMGALGCRAALLLDGGISAQLLVQAADAGRREWKGMRRVPVGILVGPR